MNTDCPWNGSSKHGVCSASKDDNLVKLCPYKKVCLSLLPLEEQKAYLERSKTPQTKKTLMELLQRK